MSRLGLAYVALAVGDVEPTAVVFEQHLGLARRDAQTPDGRTVPVFSVGDSALALFVCGDPFLDGDSRAGVHHITVAVSDPRSVAEAAGLGASDEPLGVGLDGTGELRVDAAATCGVRMRLGEALAQAPSRDGMVERIDHVGVASCDNAAATALFADKLGLGVESSQTDMEVRIAIESFTSDRHGVVYHSRPAEIVGGLRVTFITIGDCELELLEPFPAPSADAASDDDSLPPGPGNTRGDKGAIGRFIERRGPGLHHLALKTSDIDATLAALAERGLALIDRRGRPGSRRARIGFVHPRALGGVLVHFVERDEL